MLKRLPHVCLTLFGICLAVPVMAQQKQDPNVPTPEAQVLIDKVKSAYGQLESLKLDGQISVDINIGGQTDKQSVSFTSQYKAPRQYRHEVKDRLQFGSTGQRMYLYELTQDVYTTLDAPAAKGSYRDLPGVFGQVLEVQNPGLLLAISENSVADLIEGGKRVRLLEAEGENTKPTIAYTAGDGREIQLAFDPQTNLLVQARYDMAEMMRSRGAEQVNSAVVVFDYSSVQPDAQVTDESLAWTPPAQAREVPTMAGAEGEHLVGKPLPELTITTMDGKPFNLADHKGKVILLDFWASWCPPCVHGLPDVAEIHKARKDSNVEVFAINVGEDEQTIRKFLAARNLELPVLMDAEETYSKLGIDGIPLTVIIAPDGKVHKVFVGLPVGGKAEIERAIDAAAKKS